MEAYAEAKLLNCCGVSLNTLNELLFMCALWWLCAEENALLAHLGKIQREEEKEKVFSFLAAAGAIRKKVKNCFCFLPLKDDEKMGGKSFFTDARFSLSTLLVLNPCAQHCVSVKWKILENFYVSSRNPAEQSNKHHIANAKLKVKLLFHAFVFVNLHLSFKVIRKLLSYARKRDAMGAISIVIYRQPPSATLACPWNIFCITQLAIVECTLAGFLLIRENVAMSLVKNICNNFREKWEQSRVEIAHRFEAEHVKRVGLSLFNRHPPICHPPSQYSVWPRRCTASYLADVMQWKCAWNAIEWIFSGQ